MDGGYAPRGKPPRRLRAAPLHRGDKDGGFGRGLLGLDCFARLAMTVRRDVGRLDVERGTLDGGGRV
ncbi:MAG: hypothetical protein LBM98_03150 [Oscillospiraceae bacterium]|nr:hypothetical protein [Oscillospiraceae bacterium]